VRNLQKMADYSGKGLTAHIDQQLVLICQSVFRTQHRYENNQLTTHRYQKRMQRLRKSFNLLLQKGMTTPCKRYVGRCKFILKHEPSLWVFLSSPDIPLTNNEAERCIEVALFYEKLVTARVQSAVTNVVRVYYLLLKPARSESYRH